MAINKAFKAFWSAFVSFGPRSGWFNFAFGKTKTETNYGYKCNYGDIGHEDVGHGS